MARNRASRGVKLSSVTIVDVGPCRLAEEALKLREHVAHMEHRVARNAPPWDHVPDVNHDESE